ncbi:MAG: M50 family metallopeptidase [Bacteroidota bacterium]|nr:M50 family metallopeptidase [Bacteroidota bacterium]
MSNLLVIIVPIVVVILIRAKGFKSILQPLNTLIHELSHALIALLLGQKVKSIDINTDGSGLCKIKNNSKVKSFFISFVGYIIPSLLGYFIIFNLNNSHINLILYILIIISLISLVLYIRNSFGIYWGSVFCLLNITLLFVPLFSNLPQIFLYFCACVLLTENFLSTLTLLHINLLSSKKAGDCYNLQKITHIPAIFFTLFYVFFSLFMIYKSFILIKNYF